MKLYLSIVEVTEELKGKRTLSKIQSNFVDSLRETNHEFIDGAEFTDYPTIYESIESSDALIAFIDEYWASSTWKAIELWYAAGESPENRGEYIPRPIDCYLYCENANNPNIERILKRSNVFEFNGTLEDLLSIMERN